MPDIICVADLGVWSTFKMVFIGPKNLPTWDEMSISHGTNGSCTTSYVEYSRGISNQAEDYSTIGTFMVLLLKKLAWEYPNLRSLSDYFTQSISKGKSQGDIRTWDRSIYSDNVRNIVENNLLLYDKTWNEWSLIFD